MNSVSTINSVGYYCGRFSDGFWGEPQNSLTNLVFIIGAAYAYRTWKNNNQHNVWQLTIITLAASIGLGSFIFHSIPTRATLIIDLIPIQIFSISYFIYVGIWHIRSSKRSIAVAALIFIVVRYAWIAIMPPGALGGGITHIPALILLSSIGGYLKLRGNGLGKYVLMASVTYVLAFVVRSWDLALCSSFPIGVHWLWHILTGITTSTLIYGLVRVPE